MNCVVIDFVEHFPKVFIKNTKYFTSKPFTVTFCVRENECKLEIRVTDT